MASIKTGRVPIKKDTFKKQVEKNLLMNEQVHDIVMTMKEALLVEKKLQRQGYLTRIRKEGNQYIISKTKVDFKGDK
jgi:hypothetical protein